MASSSSMNMEVDDQKRSVIAPPGTIPSVYVSMHPLVLMNISEHWTRTRAQSGSPHPGMYIKIYELFTTNILFYWCHCYKKVTMASFLQGNIKFYPWRTSTVMIYWGFPVKLVPGFSVKSHYILYKCAIQKCNSI